MQVIVRRFAALSCLLFWLAAPAFAQFQYGWIMPRESQAASVSQTVGVTKIVIDYHRPAVRERAIWGALEPYDKVWRAGANEATTISFSTDVKIEGQALKAGTYGLFMLPTATEWTVIFNKDAKQWGAFTYKAEQDALRVKVTPQAAELQENMQYTFPVVTDDSATVAMHWEKLRVAFKVTIDTPAQALAKARGGFNWQSGWFAADYFYQKKARLDDALKYINASIALEENTSNLMLKARILGEMKRHDEAFQTAERALGLVDKTPNQARVKASIDKLMADLKKQKG